MRSLSAVVASPPLAIKVKNQRIAKRENRLSSEMAIDTRQSACVICLCDGCRHGRSCRHEKGTRCSGSWAAHAVAAPATVNGEHPCAYATDASLRRGLGKVARGRLSREPGDLPSHAAHLPCVGRGGAKHFAAAAHVKHRREHPTGHGQAVAHHDAPLIGSAAGHARGRASCVRRSVGSRLPHRHRGQHDAYHRQSYRRRQLAINVHLATNPVYVDNVIAAGAGGLCRDRAVARRRTARDVA